MAADAGAPRPDPLGPVPQPTELPAFHPPSPTVFAGPAGSRVWLFERHDLPLVNVALVVPRGSASDPRGKLGITYAVGRMMTEGAGERDAIAYALAVQEIGATVNVHVSRDVSVASMQSLSERFDRAATLLADAVSRPRMASKDYDRVRALWHNALVAREQDPPEVAKFLTPFLFFGVNDPYAHPPDGLESSPKAISVADLRSWHGSVWRPEQATFVVTGDATQQSVTSALGAAFGAWRPARPPAGEAPAVPAPPSSARRPDGPPLVVIVDRADAPQVVMSLAEPAVTAASPVHPRLEMLNVAFGGSFGSRLNQSLRETHGWTYGARSSFHAFRTAGIFTVGAAIRTDATSDALRETLRLLGDMSKTPLSADEWVRVRAQVQGETVMTYGNLAGIEASLAENAGMGLPPDQDARALASQMSASPQDIAALAAEHLHGMPSLVLLVGPREVAQKAVQQAGLPQPVYYDARGAAVATSSRPEGPSKKP